MRVSDVMTTGVQTVSRGTPAANARDKMRTKQIRHLVVTEESTPVGVISARDFRRVTNGSKTALVADLMTPDVVTIAATASVHRAANIMRGRSIGCLVVTDGARVVGIVTTADLLNHLAEKRHARAANQLRSGLHHRVPHRKQHRTGGSW